MRLPRRTLAVLAAFALFGAAGLSVEIPVPAAEAPVPSTSPVPEVAFTVDVNAERKLISPYIYGVNWDADLSNLTAAALKQGGTRMTTYNWETNYSNAGISNFNTNDNSFSRAGKNYPGMASSLLLAKAQQNGIPFTITTLQMAGYVAADGNGPILDSQIAPSPRWHEVQFRKPDLLTMTPDPSDGVVYMDEYVNYLINQYGKSSSATGIRAYALDNEPGLWASAHPSAHPNPDTCQELVDKSAELAAVVKELDSSALVLGGQFGGMESFLTLNQAPDWQEIQGKYNSFLDYYLASMREAGGKQGTRLLDVLDIHYTSAARAPGADHPVSQCMDYSHTECNKARLQATRTLWDASYLENSPVGQNYKQFLPVLTAMQTSINGNYPGTKLGLSSYSFGGGGDISGGLAEIDALGTFAKNGVYLACLDMDQSQNAYQKAAINLFTNYDGNGSAFGDTLVQAETTNPEYTSIYASTEQAGNGAVKVILTNLNYDSAVSASLSIRSDVLYTGGAAFGFSPSVNVVTPLPGFEIHQNHVTYQLEPRSAVELILVSGGQPAVSVSADSSISSGPASELDTSVSSSSSPTAADSFSTVVSSSSASLSASLSGLPDNLTEPEKLPSETQPEEPVPQQRDAPLTVKIAAVIMTGLAACGIGLVFLSDIFPKK